MKTKEKLILIVIGLILIILGSIFKFNIDEKASAKSSELRSAYHDYFRNNYINEFLSSEPDPVNLEDSKYDINNISREDYIQIIRFKENSQIILDLTDQKTSNIWNNKTVTHKEIIDFNNMLEKIYKSKRLKLILVRYLTIFLLLIPMVMIIIYNIFLNLKKRKDKSNLIKTAGSKK